MTAATLKAVPPDEVALWMQFPLGTAMFREHPRLKDNAEMVLPFALAGAMLAGAAAMIAMFLWL